MATCLFGERDIKVAIASLESALENAKINAATATNMALPEHRRMIAAAMVAEDAVRASTAATRLAAYGHYLSGFLSGAGVPDKAPEPRPLAGRIGQRILDHQMKAVS